MRDDHGRFRAHRAQQGQAAAAAGAVRQGNDLSDYRRGADIPCRVHAGGSAGRDPHAPRPDRRHALFPRRTREPAAQADQRGAAHVRRVYGAGWPRACPLGVSPLGELSFRGHLRHGPVGGIGRGEAGRAGGVDRAHRAGPLGGCPPAEPEGVGRHLRDRAAHRERVRQDSHRPAGRRRGGLRAAGLGGRRAATLTGVESDRRPETEQRHRGPELHLELQKRRKRA